MIRKLKELLKSNWPQLRLRSILFGILLFTATLPLFGTLFFRIYETALVQRTESELIMQGQVFAAAFAQAVVDAGVDASVRGIDPRRIPPTAADIGETRETFKPRPPTIDISRDPILPDRPLARPPANRKNPSGSANTTPSQAILAAHTAGKALDPIILLATRTTLASVRIVNTDGIVVAGRSEKGLSLAHVPEVRAALTGTSVSLLRRKANYKKQYALEFVSRAASTRVFHALPALAGGKVVGAVLLSRSPRGLFKGLYEDAGTVALGLALLFTIILAIAALLSRSITRPVELLIDSTAKVARGEYDLPPPPRTAAVEIQQLFTKLDEMAATIDQRSSYIRNFAAAVSHEFKTPLAGIRGATELLQEHADDMPAEKHAKFLNNISLDADRLNALVTRLLQLARADVLVPGTETTDLSQMFNTLEKDYNGRGLDIDVTGGPNNAVAAISPDALETVLVNLINNSAQHEATAVTIKLSPQDQMLKLLVHDNGTGVTREDSGNLFEPFFTTRRGLGGTGLGLAIARALLDAHNGTIRHISSTHGAAFEIILPRAGK